MRHLFTGPPALLALLLTACGDSAGPSDVIPEALAGSWEATPACLPECGFTLVRIDDPADSVNFVSGVGATFLLTLGTAGSFELVDPTGGSPIRGRAHVEGSLLILRDESGTRDTADYVLSGGYLELAFRGVTRTFDFDGDGEGDPSMIRARFRRRSG